MSNENKKKLERKRFKKVLASRALTSAVVLSSLVSVATLIAANGSVYNPIQKSNGIVQDNLKGKSAVNEAASILNHQATSVPAAGSPNRFDGLTTSKDFTGPAGVNNNTEKYTTSTWGEQSKQFYEVTGDQGTKGTIFDFLSYIKLSFTGHPSTTSWGQSYALAAVTPAGTDWRATSLAATNKDDAEQVRIRTKYGWGFHTSWMTTTNYSGTDPRKLDVMELDMSNGWKLGVAVNTMLHEDGSDWKQNIKDVRYTLMKDGSTQKLEMKESAGDVATNVASRFDDFPGMTNNLISGTVHIGIGGAVTTPDGANPVTASPKLKAKWSAWHNAVKVTKKPFTYSKYADKLIVTDAQATELLKHENHNAFFKLPDDFKVSDKKLRLIKTNGDKVIDINLSDEEVYRINSRLDGSFGTSATWVKINWDSSATNYSYKYHATGTKDVIDANKPTGLRDERRSTLTWKSAYSKTTTQASATTDAIDMIANGLEGEFTNVGSSLTATQKAETIAFSGSVIDNSATYNNQWSSKGASIATAAAGHTRTADASTWRDRNAVRTTAPVIYSPESTMNHTTDYLSLPGGAGFFAQGKMQVPSKKKDAPFGAIANISGIKNRLKTWEFDMWHGTYPGNIAGDYTQKSRYRLTFDKAQGRFTTVQRLSSAQAPGTSNGAYGTGETFPSTLPAGIAALVKHNGGGDAYNGTDVQINQASNGEIQFRVRCNTGWYAFFGISNQVWTYDDEYTHTFSGEKRFTSNYGANAPTNLPTGVSVHYKSREYNVSAITASNARYILGVDTQAAGNTKAVDYDQVISGFVDNATENWTPGAVTGLTQTATYIPNYDATPVTSSTKVIHTLDGDTLLAAAGIAATYRNGKLLISTTVNSKKYDITNLPEGFEWQYKIVTQSGTTIQDFTNTLPSNEVIIGNKVILKINIADADIAEITGKSELTAAEALDITPTDTEVQDLHASLGHYWASSAYSFDATASATTAAATFASKPTAPEGTEWEYQIRRENAIVSNWSNAVPTNLQNHDIIHVRFKFTTSELIHENGDVSNDFALTAVSGLQKFDIATDWTGRDYEAPVVSGLEGHGYVSKAEADLPEGIKFQYSTDGSTWTDSTPIGLSNSDTVKVKLDYTAAGNVASDNYDLTAQNGTFTDVTVSGLSTTVLGMPGIFKGATSAVDGELHLAEAITDAAVVPYAKNGAHHIYVELPSGFKMGAATTIVIKDSGTNTLVSIPLSTTQLDAIANRDDKAYVKNYVSLQWDTTTRKHSFTVTGKTSNPWIKDLPGLTGTVSKVRFSGIYKHVGATQWSPPGNSANWNILSAKFDYSGSYENMFSSADTAIGGLTNDLPPGANITRETIAGAYGAEAPFAGSKDILTKDFKNNGGYSLDERKNIYAMIVNNMHKPHVDALTDTTDIAGDLPAAFKRTLTMNYGAAPIRISKNLGQYIMSQKHGKEGFTGAPLDRQGFQNFPQYQRKAFTFYPNKEERKKLDYFEFTIIGGMEEKTMSKDTAHVADTNGHYGLFKFRVYFDNDGDISRYDVRTAGLSQNAITEDSLVSLRTDTAWKAGKWATIAKLDKDWGDISLGIGQWDSSENANGSSSEKAKDFWYSITGSVTKFGERFFRFGAPIAMGAKWKDHHKYKFSGSHTFTLNKLLQDQDGAVPTFAKLWNGKNAKITATLKELTYNVWGEAASVPAYFASMTDKKQSDIEWNITGTYESEDPSLTQLGAGLTLADNTASWTEPSTTNQADTTIWVVNTAQTLLDSSVPIYDNAAKKILGMKDSGDSNTGGSATKIDPPKNTHYEYRVRTNVKSDGTKIYTDPTTWETDGVWSSWSATAPDHLKNGQKVEVKIVKDAAYTEAFKMDLDTNVKSYVIGDDKIDKVSDTLANQFSATDIRWDTKGTDLTQADNAIIKYAHSIDKNYRLVLLKVSATAVDPANPTDAEWESVDETTYTVTGSGASWEIKNKGGASDPITIVQGGDYKIGVVPNDIKNYELTDIPAGLKDVHIQKRVEVSQMWNDNGSGVSTWITKTSDATWAPTGITGGVFAFAAGGDIPEGVKITFQTGETQLDGTAIADIVLKHGDALPKLLPGKYTITIESDDTAKWTLNDSTVSDGTAKATKINFTMGLSVAEKDILDHIQPHIDTTSGDITKIVDRAATPADFDVAGTTKFHPGMNFNFAAATPVTGTPASLWTAFGGSSSTYPTGLKNGQAVKIHVSEDTTWTAAHYPITFTDASSIVDADKTFHIGRNSATENGSDGSLPKTQIDGSNTAIFDKDAIGYTNSGFTGGTAADAPTTVLTYTGAFDENTLIFNMFKNTGTTSAPVWTDITADVQSHQNAAGEWEFTNMTGKTQIGQNAEYSLMVAAKDTDNAVVANLVTGACLFHVKEAIDVADLVNTASYTLTTASWADSATAPAVVTEGTITFTKVVPTGVTMTFHNEQDGASTTNDQVVTGAGAIPTALSVAPGNWKATVTPTTAADAELVNNVASGSEISLKINMEVDVTTVIDSVKPTFDNTGLLTDIVRSSDDSAFTLPTGVKYQYKQYDRQTTDTERTTLPATWTLLSAAKDAAPSGLLNNQKVQVSFVLDSTVTTLTYDLVLNNPKYAEHSVAAGTVDIKAIDISPDTIFDHGTSLTQVTSGVSGGTGANAPTATITYSGPWALPTGTTENTKFDLVLYHMKSTAADPANPTDADWEVVDETTYAVTPVAGETDKWDIKGTGVVQSQQYYVSFKPHDTDNFKVTGINPATVKVPGRQNVDALLESATYTWTEAKWAQGTDIKGKVVLGTAIPTGVTLTFVNTHDASKNVSKTGDSSDITETTTGILLEPGTYTVQIGVADKFITTLDISSTVTAAHTVTTAGELVVADAVATAHPSVNLEVGSTFATTLEATYGDHIVTGLTGAAAVALDIPTGMEIKYFVTERPSTDTAHDSDPSSWTTYSTTGTTTAPIDMWNGQKFKVVVSVISGADATNHFTTSFESSATTQKEFTIGATQFTKKQVDMSVTTNFDKSALESIESGYQGGTAGNAASAKIKYTGAIDEETTKLVLYELKASGNAATDADWLVVDPKTYTVTHVGAIYHIENLASPAPAAIEQGHDYKVGVAVKDNSASNWEVTKQATGVGSIHTQLRQNVAPFFQAATYTATDATVSTTAIVDGQVVIGTAIPVGVTMTVVELTGSSDTESTTNTHDLTSTSPTTLALKPGKYRVKIASDDTDVTVLDGVPSPLVNQEFTINVNTAVNELTSVIPDSTFTPTAPTTEGDTANTGKIVFDAATHAITPGFELVYYKVDPATEDPGDHGTVANPSGTFALNGTNLEATGLTPGDYWIRQELVDHNVKYVIKPASTFVEIHVAQRYLINQAATFDHTKVSAEANDPADGTLDRTKGKVHYDQAIPTGTKLVLYKEKVKGTDDGNDATYEEVKTGTPPVNVVWTETTPGHWITADVDQGWTYFVRLESTDTDLYTVTIPSTTANGGWNAKSPIPKAVLVGPLFAANNFVTVSATASNGDEAKAKVISTALIETGAKVVIHNKKDGTDTTKDFEMTETEVKQGGVAIATAPAPGHGAGSNGIMLIPGTYTFTVLPVDAASDKLFGVPAAPADKIEVKFKLDVASITPAPAWVTVTPPTTDANDDGEISIDTSPTGTPIPPQTKLVYYKKDPATTAPDPVNNPPFDFTKSGSTFTTNVADKLASGTYWFGLVSDVATVEIENPQYGSFVIQETIDASKAATWDATKIATDNTIATVGENAGNPGMQFDIIDGHVITTMTTDAGGRQVYTYTDAGSSTTHTVEVGDGIIKYEQAIPAGTTVNLYTDSACTTLVSNALYDKVTDPVTGHITWTGHQGRGQGLDQAVVYFLKLETENEDTHHVINANGEAKRIPLVIDLHGGLRGVPVAGKTDGAATSPQTDAAHPEGAGKKVEFELAGTSGGGADGHATNPVATTVAQDAWDAKRSVDAMLANLPTGDPLKGVTTEIQYLTPGADAALAASWTNTFPTGVRNRDSVQVKLKLTGGPANAIAPQGGDVPDTITVWGLDKEKYTEADFFGNTNAFSTGGYGSDEPTVDIHTWLIGTKTQTDNLPEGTKYQYIIQRVADTAFDLTTKVDTDWKDSIATEQLRNGDTIHMRLAVKTDDVSAANFEIVRDATTASASSHSFVVHGTDVDPATVLQTSFTMTAPTTVSGTDGHIEIDPDVIPVDATINIYSDSAYTTLVDTLDKTTKQQSKGLPQGTYYARVMNPHTTDISDSTPVVATPDTTYTVIVPRTIDVTAAVNAFLFVSSNNNDPATSDGNSKSTATQGVFSVQTSLLDAVRAADLGATAPTNAFDEGVEINIYKKAEYAADPATAVAVATLDEANSDTGITINAIEQLLDPAEYTVVVTTKDATKFNIIGTTSASGTIKTGFNQSNAQIQNAVNFKIVSTDATTAPIGIIVEDKVASGTYLDHVNIVITGLDPNEHYKDALLLNGRKVLATVTAKDATHDELTGATPGHTGDTVTPLGQITLTIKSLPKTHHIEADFWSNANLFSTGTFANPTPTTDKGASEYVGKLPAPTQGAPAGTKYQYHVVPLGDTTAWDPTSSAAWSDDITATALHNGDQVFMRLRSLSDDNYVVDYTNQATTDATHGTSTLTDYHSFTIEGVEYNNEKWLADNASKFAMVEPTSHANDDGKITYAGVNIPHWTQLEVFSDAAHTTSVGTMTMNMVTGTNLELTGLPAGQYYLALIPLAGEVIGSTTNPKSPIDKGTAHQEVFVQRYVDATKLLVATNFAITEPTGDATTGASNNDATIKWVGTEVTTGTDDQRFPDDVTLTFTNKDSGATNPTYEFTSRTMATAGITLDPGEYEVTITSSDATHTKIENALTTPLTVKIKRFITIPQLVAADIEVQPNGAPATYGTLTPTAGHPKSGLVGYVSSTTVDSDITLNVYAADPSDTSHKTPTGAVLGTFDANGEFKDGLTEGWYVIVPEAKDSTMTLTSTVKAGGGVVEALPFRILTAVDIAKSDFVSNIVFGRNAVSHNLEFTWKTTADANIKGTTLSLDPAAVPVQKVTPYLNNDHATVVLTANDGFELVGSTAPGNGAKTPLTGFDVIIKGLDVYHHSDKTFFTTYTDPVISNSAQADEYDNGFIKAHSTTALPVDENQPITGYEYQYHVLKTSAQLDLMSEADLDAYATDNNIDLTTATDKASKLAAIKAAVADPSSWTWHALADISSQPLINGQEVYVQLHSTDAANYAVDFEASAHPYHHFTTSGINTDVANFLTENDSAFGTVEPTAWANDDGKVTYSGKVPVGMNVSVYSDAAHATKIGDMTQQSDGTWSITVPDSGKYYITLTTTDAAHYPITNGASHKEVFVVRYIDYSQLVTDAHITKTEATDNTNADANFVWAGTAANAFPADIKLVFTPVTGQRDNPQAVEMDPSNEASGVVAIPGVYTVTAVSTDPLHANIHDDASPITVKLIKWVDAPTLAASQFEVQPLHAAAAYGTQTPSATTEIGEGSIIYTDATATPIAPELKFIVKDNAATVVANKEISDAETTVNSLGIGDFTLVPVAKDDTLTHVHYPDATQDPTTGTPLKLEVKTGIDKTEAFMRNHFVFTRDANGHVLITVEPLATEITSAAGVSPVTYTDATLADLAGITAVISTNPNDPYINEAQVPVQLTAKDHYELIGQTPMSAPIANVRIHGLPFVHYDYKTFVSTGLGSSPAAYVDPVIASKAAADLTLTNYDHGNMPADSVTALPAQTKYQYHVQHATDTFDPAASTNVDWSDSIASIDLVNGDIVFMRLVSIDTKNYLVDGIDDANLDTTNPGNRPPALTTAEYHSFTVTGIHANNDKFLVAKDNAFTQTMPTSHANDDGIITYTNTTIPVGTKLVVYKDDKVTKAGEMTQQTDGTYQLSGLTDGQYYIRLESDTEPVDLGTTFKDVFVIRNIDEAKLLHAITTTSLDTRVMSQVANVDVTTETSQGGDDSVIKWVGTTVSVGTDEQSFPADTKITFTPASTANGATVGTLTPANALTGIALKPGIYTVRIESTDPLHTTVTNAFSTGTIIVKRYVTAPTLQAADFDIRSLHSGAHDGAIIPTVGTDVPSGTIGYLSTAPALDSDIELLIRKEDKTHTPIWEGHPSTDTLDSHGDLTANLGDGNFYVIPVAKDDILTEVHYSDGHEYASTAEVPLKVEIKTGINKDKQFIIDHLVYAKDPVTGAVTATVEALPSEITSLPGVVPVTYTDPTLADLVGIKVTINAPVGPKTEFFNTDEVTMTLTALGGGVNHPNFDLVGDTPTAPFKDHVHGLPFTHISPTDFFAGTGSFTTAYVNPVVTSNTPADQTNYFKGHFGSDSTSVPPKGTEYEYFALPFGQTFDPNTATWMKQAAFAAVDVENTQKVYVRIVSTDTSNYLVDGIDDPALASPAQPPVPTLTAGQYYNYSVVGVVANSDQFLAKYENVAGSVEHFTNYLPTSSANTDGAIRFDGIVPHGVKLTIFAEDATSPGTPGAKVKDMVVDAVKGSGYIAENMIPGVYFIKLTDGATETVTGTNYQEVHVREYIDEQALLVDANVEDIEATGIGNTDNMFTWKNTTTFPNFTKLVLVNKENSADRYEINKTTTVSMADGTTRIGMVVKPGNYEIHLESTDQSRSTISHKHTTVYSHYVIEYVVSETLTSSQFKLSPETATDAGDATISFDGYNIPVSQKIELYKADTTDAQHETETGSVLGTFENDAQHAFVASLTADTGHTTTVGQIGQPTKNAGWYTMKIVSSNAQRYHVHNEDKMAFEVITENEKIMRAYMETMRQHAVDHPTQVKDSSGNLPPSLVGVGDFETTAISHDFKTDQYTTEGSPTYFNEPGEGSPSDAKVGLKYPGTKPPVLTATYKFVRVYKADDRNFKNELHFRVTFTAPNADSQTMDIIAVGYKPAVIYIDPQPLVNQNDPSALPFEIDPPSAPGVDDGTIRWTDKDPLGTEGNHWEGHILTVYKSGDDSTDPNVQPVAEVTGKDDGGAFKGLAPGNYFATWRPAMPLFNFNADFRNNPGKIPKANFIVQSPVQGKDITKLSDIWMPTTSGGQDGSIEIKATDLPQGLSYEIFKADAHGLKTGAKLDTLTVVHNKFSGPQGDYIFVPKVDHLHFYVPVSGNMADKDETFLITIERNFTNEIMQAKDKIAADVLKAENTKEVKLLQGAINPYYKPTFAEAKAQVLAQKDSFAPSDPRDRNNLPDEEFYKKMMEAEQKAQDAIANMLRVNAETAKANQVVIDLWKNRAKAFATVYPKTEEIVTGANVDAPTFFDLSELDNFDLF